MAKITVESSGYGDDAGGRYMSRKLKQLERLQRRWAQTE